MQTSHLRNLIAVAALVLFFMLALSHLVHAREPDRAVTYSEEVRKWFHNLMQPDAPEVSCCGEADGYEADDYEVVDGHVVAIITDTGSDELTNGAVRQHLEPGTRINIPDAKVKWDQGNPTGHGWVFLGFGDRGPSIVYCYVSPGGV